MNEKIQAESQETTRIIDRPVTVLLMLFFVTAALGLPALWMSRGFSKPMKWVWSVVIILYTLLILWLFYLIMKWCLTNIYDALYG